MTEKSEIRWDAVSGFFGLTGCMLLIQSLDDGWEPAKLGFGVGFSVLALILWFKKGRRC